MGNFNSYKPKEWKEKKAALEKALRDAGKLLGSVNVVRYNRGEDLALEGGSIPVVYDPYLDELFAWSRGDRYAGGKVSIAELERVREVIRNWYAEHIKNE